MLFSSKRFDESIGLSYFGARYYDAFIGRFISRDPLGYIDGPNGYIYVANNPLGFIDPFGLCKRDNISNTFLSDTFATDPIRFSQTGYIYQTPPNVVQIGGSVNFGGGVGQTKEAGVILGITPEDGFVFRPYASFGGGGHYGWGGSVTLDVTLWSDVKKIDDLEGGGWEIAGSIPFPMAPTLTIGGGLALTDSNPETIGKKFVIGKGLGSPEVHIYKTATIIIDGE